MDKIKSVVVFKMNKGELVIISEDGFRYSNVWVKEKSVISNNLQSIFLKVLRREIVVNGKVEQEMWSWFNFSTALT